MPKNWPALTLLVMIAAGCSGQKPPENHALPTTNSPSTAEVIPLPTNTPYSVTPEGLPTVAETTQAPAIFSAEALTFLESTNYDTESHLVGEGQFNILTANQGPHLINEYEKEVVIERISRVSNDFASWLSSYGYSLPSNPDGSPINIFLLNSNVSGNYGFTSAKIYPNGLTSGDIGIMSEVWLKSGFELEYTVAHELFHVIADLNGGMFVLQSGPGEEAFADAGALMFIKEAYPKTIDLNGLEHYALYQSALFNSICNDNGCDTRKDNINKDDYKYWPLFWEMDSIGGLGLLLDYPSGINNAYYSGSDSPLVDWLRSIAPDGHIFSQIKNIDDLHAAMIALLEWGLVRQDRAWYPAPVDSFGIGMLTSSLSDDGSIVLESGPLRNATYEIPPMQGKYEFTSNSPHAVAVLMTPSTLQLIHVGDFMNLNEDLTENAYLVIYMGNDAILSDALALSHSLQRMP